MHRQQCAFARLHAWVTSQIVLCAEGYTPLMVALHRGRLECAKALLRVGADPNFVNNGGDLTLFWAIDGGVETIKLCKVGSLLLSFINARMYKLLERPGLYPKAPPVRSHGSAQHQACMRHGATACFGFTCTAQDCTNVPSIAAARDCRSTVPIWTRCRQRAGRR